MDNAYKVHMKLTIRSVSPTDYGSYKCVAKNSLGETDGTIKLYRKYNFTVYAFFSFEISKDFCHNIYLQDFMILYTLNTQKIRVIRRFRDHFTIHINNRQFLYRTLCFRNNIRLFIILSFLDKKRQFCLVFG